MAGSSGRVFADTERMERPDIAQSTCWAFAGANGDPRKPEGFLFPSYAHGKGYYPLRDCWRAVCEDAKLGRLRLHDLRHTAASQAVMAGENLPLVGKLLGHRRHRTTADYAHLADAHLVEAVEKVANVIHRAMSNTDSSSPPLITEDKNSERPLLERILQHL